jgi:hypothetical protein
MQTIEAFSQLIAALSLFPLIVYLISFTLTSGHWEQSHYRSPLVAWSSIFTISLLATAAFNYIASQ